MFQNIIKIEKKQVTFLIILNAEGQNYIAVNYGIITALLRGITSKKMVIYIVLLSLFVQNKKKKKKLKSHKNICENKDFCNIVIPSEKTKILEFNQQEKPHKASFIFYADVEYLIKRLDGRKIIRTIHPQQKQITLFHDPFQCLRYHHLKTQEISLMYTNNDKVKCK